VAVKGKWAQGIEPRNFHWVVKGTLAVCERPGGYGANHRRVRRQEEIIWVREQGFTPVISIIPSPPTSTTTTSSASPGCTARSATTTTPVRTSRRFYPELRDLLAVPEAKLLIHGEELGDRLSGIIAGYLVWSGLVPSGPKAISLTERLLQRQLGPPAAGELVTVALELAAPWLTPLAPGTATGSSCAACAGGHLRRAARGARTGPAPRGRPRRRRRPRAAGRSDELADTIDYGALCDTVATVVAGGSPQLLEHLAQPSPMRCSPSTVASRPSPSRCASSVRPVPHALATSGVRVRRVHRDPRLPVARLQPR
jgi:hypothetical protein